MAAPDLPQLFKHPNPLPSSFQGPWSALGLTHSHPGSLQSTPGRNFLLGPEGYQLWAAAPGVGQRAMLSSAVGAEKGRGGGE